MEHHRTYVYESCTELITFMRKYDIKNDIKNDANTGFL